ncbi:MAG: SusC/RagA family TonB-linked outer membrane protein [Chitinophagaceae bacterium]|nr:MAG: SusC/RagA family TonB-linked outer membrane protein [Chitinophagaceae bacterium]
MRKVASLAMFMLLAVYAFAQTRTVTGQVKDSKGDPVPFANVTVKGTTTGTSADVNGNFKIEVKDGESLLVSSVNFAEQEIKIGSESTVIVTLQPQGSLEEVVVTALGIKRTRNQVSYAAQQVSGDEVSRARSNNFTQNLSGKIAGLDIKQNNSLGGSTNVVIRGVKSITGNNQALFVIDGIPFDNSNNNTSGQRQGGAGYDYGNAAADVNPDDIASVTVLKGAAASALYGSRGANGVILITTKKGNKGLGITVNSGIGIGKVNKETFAKYQNSYGAGYGAFYEDPSGYFLYRDIDGDGTEDLVAPFLEDASYGGPFDPNLQVYQWDSFDPTSPNFGKSRPWVAGANQPIEFFQTALSSNQSIYIDGADDRASFKLGYTRNDDRGILPNSRITKNLINFGATYKVTEKLVAGASLNFSNIAGRGRYGTGYDDKNIMTNMRQWWQTNIDLKDQEDAYFRTRQNVTWNPKDPDNLTPNFWDNPYFTRYENYETDRRDRYFGNVSLNYNVTDWLNILGRISLDSYDELQEERQAVGSVTPSAYSRFNRAYRETNFDLLATVDKNFGTDINFKALAGVNIRKQNISTIRASTNGGLIVPGIYALANSLNTPNAPVEVESPREINGVFAGATITWREMLTLDATIRRDQSSTLPKDNNAYYYPSVSGGFVFSKLLPSATWLTYGKLRANYAQVGADAPIFSVYDVYTIPPVFGPNPQASVTSTKNNLDLQPEITRSFEVGLETQFFKNRLGFDLTYYKAKSIDQILPVVFSTATGYSSQFLNAGTIENKGVELSLTGSPVQTKDFTWTVNVNYARNRNKVLSLFGDAENLKIADFQAGVSLNATIGEPFGLIRGQNYVYTADDKGAPQRTVGANGRYLLSPTSNEVVGNANPDWTGGVANSFRYKNVTFSFLIDTRQGGDIFSLDLYYGMGTGLYPETVFDNDLGNPSRDAVADGGGVILPGVKEDGTVNDIRRGNSEGTLGYRQPTGGFIYDASYVKLREVALSYAFPKEIVSRLKFIKGIDLSLVGRNLWIIDKNLPYADPEESMSAGNFQGYQTGAYPTARTFTVNARIRF